MSGATQDNGSLRRIGVLGGGTMGCGIAEIVGRAGHDAVVVEVSELACGRARARIEGSLETAVARGKLTQAEADDALGRVSLTDDVQALHDRQLVVEAVVEDKAAKLEAFAGLVEVVEDPDAILASNTSSIPIVEIATAAGPRSGQVLGIHFFNPVPVLSLVEIIPSLLTEDAVVERARRFVEAELGKEAILAPDRAGFTVNALLIPYLLAAIRMFEQGLASAEDIDDGMVNGCRHPMGPLALADLIGLDTVLGVAETLYAEQREPLYAPPALLQRLVSAGLLGRKTGRGLYQYAGT